MFVLLAQAEKRYTVSKYERDQLRKRHVFLYNLPSPDPKQQKRFAEEATQQRQRLEGAFGETIQLYSDVYQGVDQLHEKTVTEILVSYGVSSFPGEYEQIVQCVKSAEAAESWETGKADKHVSEAVNLAIEIKLRRKDAAWGAPGTSNLPEGSCTPWPPACMTCRPAAWACPSSNPDGRRDVGLVGVGVDPAVLVDRAGSVVGGVLHASVAAPSKRGTRVSDASVQHSAHHAGGS